MIQSNNLSDQNVFLIITNCCVVMSADNLKLINVGNLPLFHSFTQKISQLQSRFCTIVLANMLTNIPKYIFTQQMVLMQQFIIFRDDKSLRNEGNFDQIIQRH